MTESVESDRRQTGRRGAVAATTALAIAAAAVWAVRDYRSWRRLGVGGLPPNPAGWLTSTRLRLVGHDPFRVRAPVGPAAAAVAPDLRARRGPRPRVAPHPIPHRVLDQHPSVDLRARVQGVFDELAHQRPPVIEYRTSRWEKHNQALWLHSDAPFPETGRVPGSEVGHLHPSDASAHVVLGPADAQRVIDLGWGELHPLAGSRGLPPTYTLLYPPRTAGDVEAIRAILAAAVAHATGDAGRGGAAPT